MAERALANCKDLLRIAFLLLLLYWHDTHRVSSKILDEVCVGGEKLSTLHRPNYGKACG